MLSIENKKISVGTRLGAMLLDHFFMCVIAMLFFVPSMISKLSGIDDTSHEQMGTERHSVALDYIKLFGVALYFCKDIFNGRSIAKRILKLQIVDNKTGLPASPLKCFIRNLLCIIWPIEVIIAAINTSRRIGDRVAGTKLVEFDTSSKQPKINIWKALLPVGISYGFVILISQFPPNLRTSKINYSESSYNQVQSKDLEKLLIDSLGQYLTPDIRIYDTIKNENVKYLTGVLKLKENYIGDENSYRQLNEITLNLIYSKIPKEDFTGQLRYFYKTKGFYKSITTTIGTPLRLKKD